MSIIDIESLGYSVYEKCSIKSANVFFNKYLYSRTIASLIYFIGVFLGIGSILLSILSCFNFEEIMTNLGLAIFIFVPYTIIHEGIHLLCYVVFGGKNAGIGVERGTLYSYCNRHLLTGKQYTLCALMPVALTSIVCLFIYLFYNDFRGMLGFFFVFQLYGAYLDVSICNYCNMNKGVFFYGDQDEGYLYFLKKQ